jgi:hypothetical protein
VEYGKGNCNHIQTCGHMRSGPSWVELSWVELSRVELSWVESSWGEGREGQWGPTLWTPSDFSTFLSNSLPHCTLFK